MKNLTFLIILTLGYSLMNANTSKIKNDTIQDNYKEVTHDSSVETTTVNLNTTDTWQITPGSFNAVTNNGFNLHTDETEMFALVFSDISSEDGLTEYFTTIMSTFRTGLSIWDSGSNRTLANNSSMPEENYKVKLSIGTTNHGAGLKITF